MPVSEIIRDFRAAQSVSMPRGSFDPVVGYWPTGKPMLQSEREGIAATSRNLFDQLSAIVPEHVEAPGGMQMSRPAYATEAQPGPGGGTPEVWAPKPYSVTPVYRRDNGPNEHTWSIQDYRGEKAGGIDTTWNPDTGNLNVDNIDAVGGNANTLGPAAIRQLRSALLDQYPGVKTLTGLRISGATYHDKGGGVGEGRNAIQYIPQQ